MFVFLFEIIASLIALAILLIAVGSALYRLLIWAAEPKLPPIISAVYLLSVSGMATYLALTTLTVDLFRSLLELIAAPLVAVVLIMEAFELNLRPAALTILAFTGITIFLIFAAPRRTAWVWPIVIGPAAVLIAISVQGTVSEIRLRNAATAIGADCVEITGLKEMLGSMSWFEGRFWPSYHGIARAQDEYYVWSYRADAWLPVFELDFGDPLNCECLPGANRSTQVGDAGATDPSGQCRLS